MTGDPLRRATQQQGSAVASKELPLTPSHSNPILLAGHVHRDPVGNLLATLSRIFVGFSFLAFGVQHFRYSGYISDLGLVPDWAPAHLFWAWVAGAALLLTGLSVLAGKYARFTTFVLGIVFVASAFIRFSTHLGGMVHNVSDRTVFFELLCCGGGSWMLSSIFNPDLAIPSASISRNLATVGRWLLAVANIVFGIGHFQVVAYIAFLIPHWLPFRLFLAWFTGCAFVAAGISIAAQVWARLAATLLGVMYFFWVVILHAPRIAHALHNRDEWNSGYVCLTMAGCAFIAAALAPKVSTSR